MKHIFCVENPEQLQAYQSFSAAAQAKLTAYLEFLRTQYTVTDLPRAIVWTSAQVASQLISDIPIPAYTNEYRTVFCPEPEVWRDIYLRQLDSVDAPEIREYYETKLAENHILQILGHEFVHHSDLFIDEAYEHSRWFEEGMCEYISRKYFLSDAEFDEEARMNALLVKQLSEQYGKHPMEDFGSETYKGNYASIFFEYWRSFLAVQQILERFHGNVTDVFREYHRWYLSERETTLYNHFFTNT